MVAFLAALGVACTRDQLAVVAQVEASFWLHGDTRFTAHERKMFEMAAELWRLHTRGRVNVWVVWDLSEERLMDLRDQPRIIRVDSTDARVAAIDAQHPGDRCRAFLRPAGDGLPSILGIVADRIRDDLYRVALHELGHLVGVDELAPGREGIMNSRNPGFVFTEADDEKIRALGLMP